MAMYSPYGVKNKMATQPGQAQQQQTGGTFRGGLQTEFGPGQYSNDPDADVREAQGAQRFLDAGIYGDMRTVVESRRARAISNINTKNALAEQIATAEGGMKSGALHDVYGEATRALNQGLKKTNENYNNRGLLYSGLREGGEQKVRAGVGAKLSSDIASTNREMSNVAAKAKAAYAQVGLQNQQQTIELANQAFETASRNNVARLQAYQQFWGGLGQAAGTYFGSREDASAPSGVVANYRADQGGAGNRPGLLAGVGE
jgi:hypothetical protein